MNVKKNYLVLVVIATLFYSCAPKTTSLLTKEFDVNDYSLIKSDSLTLKEFDLSDSDFSKVLVYKLHHKFPTDAPMVRIGSLNYMDTGFTVGCDYYSLIAKANKEAKAKGANIIREIEVKKPKAFGSSCYQLKLELYKFKGDIKSLDHYKETFPSEK